MSTRTESGTRRAVGDQLLGLHTEHYVAVVDLAQRLSDGDRGVAEDLAQEVFTEAGRALEQPDGPHGWDTWAWFRTTTHRAVQARTVEGSLMVAAADVANVFADVAGARVDHVLVRRGLKRLDPLEAAALDLHYVRDLSQAQTARLLGVTPARVTSLLRDGIQRLRDEYLAVAEAAGRLTVVQWLVRCLRRLRATYHRLIDERLAAGLRADALPGLGVWATTATNLTLATFVAATVIVGGSSPNRTVRIRAATPAGARAEKPAASVPGPGSDAQSSTARRAMPPMAELKVSPVVATRAKSTGTEYVVTPVAGRVEKSYDFELLPGAPGGVSTSVRLECPPPDRRPPGPAIGCPLMEAVS